MSRSTVTLSITAIVVLLATSCSRSASSPAETQAGAASDLNKPPQAGSARAKCSDLPSAEDLKKWLRTAGKTRVGGLGVSGDPEKGEFVDDIVFTSADGASPFAHPLCANTWRNGKKLGDEAKAVGY